MWSGILGSESMFSIYHNSSFRYEVDEMLGEVEEKRTGHAEQPIKPLLRLRVEYNDEAEMLNPSR